jgi:hypothetical protein
MQKCSTINNFIGPALENKKIYTHAYAVARELNVHFSTISCLQRHFREFGITSNRSHNRRPSVCRRVGEWFVDVNVVNTVPHGSVMVWAGKSYGQ